MTFKEITERFAHSESGSDSFKLFFKEAFELMKADPDNAGLYFVVGVAAQTYVIKYEDQAVDPEFADRAKATLEGFNSRLLQALDMDPLARLRVLGEVAVEYEWKVDAF
ncbi:hypothetical protein [Pusillimonas noertemannii]|uniref:Uncharacterized protein n=1 Tax=Pusillimonas noertemannii TaxID=305977 RepID=A0A2U1CMW7_9BURK|nr:hypothetical protein [Pusillimonas noertemannii]NYT68619.1 hypothetical protein [Pusillimonas noertemannii]PVY62363.1 hypothetical protein C7440_1856 [Pusillimonas noertemannii]TFL10667.1 hypothetical protein CSC72_09085 [Pusillimonas noertemannii]